MVGRTAEGEAATGLRRFTSPTFRSMRSRNYRLYLYGQLISTSGTRMQTVALAWLVLRMTGSGFAVGLVTALQFLPMLLISSWGGVLGDRLDKRRDTRGDPERHGGVCRPAGGGHPPGPGAAMGTLPSQPPRTRLQR